MSNTERGRSRRTGWRLIESEHGRQDSNMDRVRGEYNLDVRRRRRIYSGTRGRRRKQNEIEQSRAVRVQTIDLNTGREGRNRSRIASPSPSSRRKAEDEDTLATSS